MSYLLVIELLAVKPYPPINICVNIPEDLAQAILNTKVVSANFVVRDKSTFPVTKGSELDTFQHESGLPDLGRLHEKKGD